MKTLTILAATLIIAAAPASAARDAAPDVGPAPEKASGTALVEEAIKATLKDPDSARFSWPNEFRNGSYKPFGFHRRVFGWYTCGTVNAKNSYGGYAGKSPVLGVIANGKVVYTNMDEGRYPMLGDQCAKVGMPVL
jgi:hypothetical protein